MVASRWVYQGLLALIFGGLQLTRVRRTNRLRVRQRLGSSYPKGPFAIHIHCVSVGEVNAAQPLIRRLVDHDQGPILVTTTTATGAEAVGRLLPPMVVHAYLPLDASWAVRRFLDQVQPKKIVIVEVEVWPNLIHLATRRGIPVYLVNGRLTERSLKRYLRWPSLFVPTIKALKAIGAQGDRDERHFLCLGADHRQVVATGNLKFDLELPLDPENERTLQRRRFGLEGKAVVVAGSTHAPEEQVLLSVYEELRKKHPGLMLVVVPRHPQRFEEVAALMTCLGPIERLSSQEAQPAPVSKGLVLADRMGVLRQLYACADMAWVGGSLAERGGHNALEPAAMAVPMAMGPSQFNNPEICQFLTSAGCLHTVSDETTLRELFEQWLDDPASARGIGRLGFDALASQKGATEKTYRLLEEGLGTKD
jgi:3-deoxy-D-manno-octulosonic-acid transferase